MTLHHIDRKKKCIENHKRFKDHNQRHRFNDAVIHKSQKPPISFRHIVCLEPPLPHLITSAFKTETEAVQTTLVLHVLLLLLLFLLCLHDLLSTMILIGRVAAICVRLGGCGGWILAWLNVAGFWRSGTVGVGVVSRSHVIEPGGEKFGEGRGVYLETWWDR